MEQQVTPIVNPAEIHARLIGQAQYELQSAGFADNAQQTMG